jgi:hypothetical protein
MRRSDVPPAQVMDDVPMRVGVRSMGMLVTMGRRGNIMVALVRPGCVRSEHEDMGRNRLLRFRHAQTDPLLKRLKEGASGWPHMAPARKGGAAQARISQMWVSV